MRSFPDWEWVWFGVGVGGYSGQAKRCVLNRAHNLAMYSLP
jgi:hypothetical protein